MSTHRWPCHHRARALSISLLILSLVHTPWPRADFHNVRHHDGPGQVCEFHDHLLRWHPNSGLAEDVAILHWHWVAPSTNPDDGKHSGDRPTIHAHADGWEAMAPDVSPLVVPDTASRRFLPMIACLLSIDIEHPGNLIRLRSGTGLAPPNGFGATFAPGVSLSAWLQRWSC